MNGRDMVQEMRNFISWISDEFPELRLGITGPLPRGMEDVDTLHRMHDKVIKAGNAVKDFDNVEFIDFLLTVINDLLSAQCLIKRSGFTANGFSELKCAVF